MSSLLKNILLLALLLGLGLILLGAFNAGVRVKGDTSVYKTVAVTWDTYLDTSSWKSWRFPKEVIVWKTGRPGQLNASWEVVEEVQGPVQMTISEMIKDSLLVIESTGPDGWKMQETAMFTLDNGQSKVEVERLFEIEGFMPNVALNWEMSTLEKDLENQLKDFKALFDKE